MRLSEAIERPLRLTTGNLVDVPDRWARGLELLGGRRGDRRKWMAGRRSSDEALDLGRHACPLHMVEHCWFQPAAKRIATGGHRRCCRTEVRISVTEVPSGQPPICPAGRRARGGSAAVEMCLVRRPPSRLRVWPRRADGAAVARRDMRSCNHEVVSLLVQGPSQDLVRVPSGVTPVGGLLVRLPHGLLLVSRPAYGAGSAGVQP
jgi:hypothetical protein